MRVERDIGSGLHNTLDDSYGVGACHLGRGQELYGEAAEFLRQFMIGATKRTLRRCFRNTETVTKFAIATFEANWNTDKVSPVLRKLTSRGTETELEYARPGGELPNLVAIDESSLDDVSEGMYPEAPQLWEPHRDGVVGVSDDPPGETYWKVANGIRLSGMPAFKKILNETEMWQVSQLLANADKPLPPGILTLLKQPLDLDPAAPQSPQ